MRNLDLKDVTLFCVDDIRTREANALLERLDSEINFAETILFSSSGLATHKIQPIKSLRDYSEFVINDLPDYISSSFAMCVQLDGYPINLNAWTDEFLKYDYIGAPWTWVPPNLREETCPVGKAVGNGGFSIRSNQLMAAARDHDYSKSKSDEDVFICREISDLLQLDGIEFAPVELACFFSVENSPYNHQFGFHGKETIRINKELRIFE
jgi:hypothetical protein